MPRMSQLRLHWSVSIIPVAPEFIPGDDALAAALMAFSGMSLCSGLVPSPMPTLERHAVPRFYGSEGFSYSARCPTCGAVVRRDGKIKGTQGRRWFARIDDMAAQGLPGDTLVTMSACDHDAALGGIAFEFPTGAARWALVCDLPIWLDGWLDDGEPGATEALATFHGILGAPVRLVRRLFHLHPQYRQAIASLVSDDPALRAQGLAALGASCDDVHEDGAIFAGYIEDHEDDLTAVLATDPDLAVRERVLGLLVEGKCFNDVVHDAVADGLRRCDDKIRDYLHWARSAPPSTRVALIPLVRAVATDPAPLVRHTCAQALRDMQAHAPEDRAVLRALALESELFAVYAMRDWIKASRQPVDNVDLQVLREVAAHFPSDSAGRVAKDVLDRL
jgi:hypothetical protein